MIRIATWNLWLAAAGTPRMDAIQRRLDAVAADINILTEVRPEAIPGFDETFSSGQHPIAPQGTRKVAIVSKLPMQLVDNVGSPDLPPNNFVAVDVETDADPIRVIGIVVRYNQIGDYINALPAALEANKADRMIVAGDFNLPVPDGALSRQLVAVLEQYGLTIVTAGDHEPLKDEIRLKDHIAVTTDTLPVSKLQVWPRRDPSYMNGEKRVSDHAGVAIDVK